MLIPKTLIQHLHLLFSHNNTLSCGATNQHRTKYSNVYGNDPNFTWIKPGNYPTHALTYIH